MCWNRPDGSNCDSCQAIFDACIHGRTFKNEKGKDVCVFCDKIIIGGDKNGKENK